MQRHSIDLTWDESVVQRVAHEYDIHYGARSLQHAVDQLVINRLAHAHEQVGRRQCECGKDCWEGEG